MTNLHLAIGSEKALARYVARQLDNLFQEDGLASDLALISPLVAPALERLRPILASVRCFDPACFNHFNSLQYASWLYLLANEHWRRSGDTVLASRLFCLNRALNAIDLFYSVEMPEVFFISHGLGTVIGNATYGKRLVVFQNVTVGRVGQDRPQVGDNVVLYPGAVVTGKAVIGNNCVVSAGTVLHGVSVPDNTVVKWNSGQLEFISTSKDYTNIYLYPSVDGRNA